MEVWQIISAKPDKVVHKSGMQAEIALTTETDVFIYTAKRCFKKCAVCDYNSGSCLRGTAAYADA